MDRILEILLQSTGRKIKHPSTVNKLKIVAMPAAILTAIF